MTVWGFLADVVWAAVVLALGREAAKIGGDMVAAWFMVHRPKDDTGQPRPMMGKIELPDDLEAVAMAESEEWAREDQRAVIREKFLEHDGNWQKVRRAMGVGEMPV